MAKMKAAKRNHLEHWQFAAPAEKKLPINDAATPGTLRHA